MQRKALQYLSLGISKTKFLKFPHNYNVLGKLGFGLVRWRLLLVSEQNQTLSDQEQGWWGQTTVVMALGTTPSCWRLAKGLLQGAQRGTLGLTQHTGC